MTKKYVVGLGKKETLGIKRAEQSLGNSDFLPGSCFQNLSINFVSYREDERAQIPRSPVCNDLVCLFLEIFQSTIDDNLSHTEPEIQVIPSWLM